MKGGIFVVLCLALICTLTVSASYKREVLSAPGSVVTNQTLEEILNTNFTGFSRLLQSVPSVWARITGATETNAITIFAPTNAGLNASKITTPQDTLEYHLHQGDLASAYIKHFFTTPTLYHAPGLNNNSQVLSFTTPNTSVVINGQTTILETDIIATNGIIHAISGVIPIPAASVFQIAGEDFTNLTSLLKRVNITLDANNIALLAPTDSAFTNLFNTNPLLRNYLFGTSLPSTYQNIISLLTGHVVVPAFYPTNLNNGTNVLRTLGGADIDIAVDGFNGKVTVLTPAGAPEAYVVQPNFLGTNGVVHGIDAVLTYGFGIDLLETLTALNATTFLSALNSTGLHSLLDEAAPHTIFVPTNKALSGLTVNQTQLLYHVAQIQNLQFTNTYVSSLLNLTTLGGQYQQLYASTFKSDVNSSANITAARINGINVAGPYTTKKGTYVYLIDSVIPIPSDPETALKANNFTDLVGLLNLKQVSGEGLFNIANSSRVTILAPTTDAFNRLPIGIVGFLRLSTGNSPKAAQAILNNHIIPNTTIYRFPDGNTLLTTAQNTTLDVFRSARNNPIVNGSTHINPVGVLTSNGIAYPVDAVILPPGLSFTSLDILNGLPAENVAGQDYGNYSTFIRHLQITGLYDLLSSTTAVYTIFPPTNSAWDNAADSFNLNKTEDIDRLRNVLNYHILYGQEPARLNQSNVFVPGVNTTNTTLVVSQAGDNVKTQVQLHTAGAVDTATVLVNTTSSYGQRIYGVDRVLGLGVRSKAHGGLSTLEWILIGVGGAVLGLIILLIVAGAAYYLLVRPGRDGYRQIN